MAKYSAINRIKSYVWVIGLSLYNFMIVTVQSFDYMSLLFGMLGESMTMTGRLCDLDKYNCSIHGKTYIWLWLSYENDCKGCIRHSDNLCAQ